MSKLFQSGETIVEVALAFAIFSVAAMGSMLLINRGVATTQRNLEITTVRQQINTQAELIRYIKDTVDPLWKTLIDPSNIVTDPSGLDKSCIAPASMTKAFFISPQTVVNPSTGIDATKTQFKRVSIIPGGTYDSPDTYAKIDYSSNSGKSYGIWLQATTAAENRDDSDKSAIKAYDFYVHACWNSVGVSAPITLGTIVRVYD